MVQLHNFFFFITSMVVPRGTAAPVLLKWFFSRDVPIGAPSSNGTIIPIPISLFPLLIYLHSRKFIRSMDGAKSGVLVRASRPILLPDTIRRSSPETRARNALSRFVPYEKRGRDDIIYVRTAPRGVDPASTQVFDQGTGKFPLPLAGQPGRERGGNRLPKKPAPGRGQHRMKGMALTDVVSALPTSWVTGG
ncbi:hypothetical protein DKX38_018997 [Salix brachista]|uniref:Cytochrome c biogenesis FC n=1 Tax=Salix brachista TaxID=2182728 RepID=A0A5N5KPS5_9ROSI|nr:hypothetical protein DKX38_018997 [Salix brachista]